MCTTMLPHSTPHNTGYGNAFHSINRSCDRLSWNQHTSIHVLKAHHARRQTMVSCENSSEKQRVRHKQCTRLDHFSGMVSGNCPTFTLERHLRLSKTARLCYAGNGWSLVRLFIRSCTSYHMKAGTISSTISTIESRSVQTQQTSIHARFQLVASSQ